MLKSYGSLDMQSLNCTLSVCTRVQYLNIDHLNKFCCIILITTALLVLMKTRGYEMNTQKYMCYDIYLPRHYKDISLEKYYGQRKIILLEFLGLRFEKNRSQKVQAHSSQNVLILRHCVHFMIISQH